MSSPVYTQTFPLPPVSRREALRYAGAKSDTPELSGLLEEALAEAEPLIAGKVCWQEFPVSRQDGLLDLGFTRSGSRTLEKHLSGCDRIVVFGATLGLPLDRLISRYSQVSPARALILQGIGTERVEALCDTFCETVRRNAEEVCLRAAPRFSPGYGDIPLTMQQDIFRVLDCPRKIGLTLNESLLMSPSKSVTAIIGIGPGAIQHHPAGCSRCEKTDCVHRRTL